MMPLIPILRVNKHTELIRWLQSNCDYSDGSFKDPGYTKSYRSWFNITDHHNVFYDDGDIDHKINIGYVDYMFEQDKDPEDIVIEQYMDFIPRKVDPETIRTAIMNCSPDEADHIRTTMTRTNMVILPGSNHSNANYLFKALTSEMFDKEYEIPYVPANPKEPFKGVTKKSYPVINKEEFYQFLKDHSKKRGI
jgi:hypothetical protein